MRVVTKKLRLRQPTFMGLFEGVGGFSVGLEAAGWKPIAHVERDKYAQQVLRRHWPDVPLMDDVTEVTADGIAQATGGVLPDLICGGFPCFPAGTLITTKRGQVPIQEVEVGDEVLTHRNRWRRVVQHHGSHRAEVLRLKGHGQPRLDTTANHPLWSSTSEQVWNNTARRYLTPMSRPEWRRADSMLGKYWASPVVFPESKVPEVTSTDRESDLPPVNTPEFMWFVGLYLGDGWCRNDSQLVGVGVAFHEEAEVRARLLATGLPFTDYRDRTTHRFQISRGSLVRWLLEHFGTGSGGKQVPAWALGMDEPLRRALVDGYRFSDGCASPGGWKATTISKSLAVTMRMLAQSLGWSVALHYSERPDTCVIEGRTVSQQNTWQLVAQERSPEGRIIDGQRFGRVRGTQPLTKMEVYNFEVEEDHSYVADGVTVKNCQDISLAGHRRGLAGERSGLWWEFHRIIDEVRPQYALIENVGGLLSSSGGRDLGAILGALGELGYGYAYRVLDSRHFGVPQRRRRVFIVASLDHWDHPGEVLLEPEGVRRDPAPSREEGEAASRAFEIGSVVEGEPRGARAVAVAPTVDTKARNGPRQGQTSVAVVHPRRPVDGWTEVGSLSASLGGAGPDAAHAFANWLVSVAKDGEQSVPTIVYNVHPVSVAIERNMLTARVTDEAEALTASFAKRSDRGDLVLQAHPVAVRGREGGAEVEQGEEGTFFALRAGDGGSSRAQWVVLAKGLAFNQRDEPRFADDEAYALQATPGEQLVMLVAAWDNGQGDPNGSADGNAFALNTQVNQGVATLAIPVDVFRKLHRATSVEDHETWAEGEVANTLNTYDEGDVRTTHAIVSVKMVPEDDGEVVRTILTSQGRQDLDSDTFVTVLATPGELAVRRLLPTETERLQAFPTVASSVTVDVWLNRPSAAADDPKPSPRTKRAGSVGRTSEPASAAAAGSSRTRRRATSRLVPPDVHLVCGENAVELLCQGKSVWSASTAAPSSSSARRTEAVDVAQLVAGISSIVERTTQHGRAGSPRSGGPSTTHRSGSVRVSLCGSGTTPPASAAANASGTTDGSPTTFTTSSRGGTRPTEPDVATLCCSVLNAIAGFIPSGTLGERFSLQLDTEWEWTEWGRKEDGSRVEISDTQRYKMMGNALTVNVATWIGKRLYRTWLRDVL